MQPISNLSICSSVKEILTYVKYFSIKNVDEISEFSHSKRQLSYGQFINNILTENLFFSHMGRLEGIRRLLILLRKRFLTKRQNHQLNGLKL